jgi:Subtilase family
VAKTQWKLGLCYLPATYCNITVVVAAGNDYGNNTCETSPGSEPSAITVGSTAEDNSVSDFSNIGMCVDIMAPGSNIQSVTSCDRTDGLDCTLPVTALVVPAWLHRLLLGLQHYTYRKREN